LIQCAESLGGIETLLTSPTEQTHADVAVEQWKLGITEKLLRLSVGVKGLILIRQVRLKVLNSHPFIAADRVIQRDMESIDSVIYGVIEMNGPPGQVDTWQSSKVHGAWEALQILLITGVSYYDSRISLTCSLVRRFDHSRIARDRCMAEHHSPSPQLSYSHNNSFLFSSHQFHVIPRSTYVADHFSSPIYCHNHFFYLTIPPYSIFPSIYPTHPQAVTLTTIPLPPIAP
jgi:hypothetical protein